MVPGISLIRKQELKIGAGMLSAPFFKIQSLEKKIRNYTMK